MKAVKITLTDEEYERFKEAAGYEPLASWAKRMILSTFGASSPKGNRQNSSERSQRDRLATDEVGLTPATGFCDTASHYAPKPEISEKTKSKREVKKCQHGTEKGYNCWQCGGIAKV